MTEYNHDLEAAEYAEMLFELGCYEEEFTFYGFTFFEDKKRKYYMTGDAEKAYNFLAECMENDLMVTPVEKYYKWCKVQAGQKENLKQKFKLDFAKKMQKQYSVDFFDFLIKEFNYPASNAALNELYRLKNQLNGSFDIDGIEIFEGILKMMFNAKKIRHYEYWQLKKWSQRERQNCLNPIPALKTPKVLSGFAYEKNNGELAYVCNATNCLAIARQDEMAKCGIFTTPIFRKKYYCGSLEEFYEVKKDFEKILESRCGNEYVRYIKELRSLGKNQQQNINADKFNDDEKRAIAYYQHLRYGK